MVKVAVILKTISDAWQWWKELRKAALVAKIQVSVISEQINEDKEEAEWETVVARINFVQDWAWEANKDKQNQGDIATLPAECYNCTSQTHFSFTLLASPFSPFIP